MQAVVLGLVLTVLWFMPALGRITASPPDFDAACLTGQPYYVAATYRGQSSRNSPPNLRAPAVVLFQDTPNDSPHYSLATYNQIGTVWGLAYSKRDRAVYAATYHKRAMPYGPDGPGAIYRIDLVTGEARHFVTVPNAGTRQRSGRMPDGSFNYDEDSARDVGKTALGDIDFNQDESELYVMNLEDRRIYRYAMPAGTLLGSFEHGAVGQPWKDDARPFGLATFNGRLYHAVLNSRGVGPSFVAKIYRSDADGAGMQEVASLKLGYKRDSIRLRTVAGSSVTWRQWSDQVAPFEPYKRPSVHDPQPMLTDLSFTLDGQMVIALRDRYWDLDVQWINEDLRAASTYHPGQPSATPPAPPVNVLSEMAMGFGDVLLGARISDDAWDINTNPEHFDDTNAMRHEESAQGGLAWVPGTGQVAATSYGVKRAASETIVADEGIYIYDVPSGNKSGHEALGSPVGMRPYGELVRGLRLAWADGPWIDVEHNMQFLRDIASLGDVEVLCIYDPSVPTGTPPTVPPPSETPTDTPEPPTDTPAPPTNTPTNTSTRPPPTVTNTPLPPSATPSPTPKLPAYLPIALRERCDPQQVHTDTVLVLDSSISMTGAKSAAAKAAAMAFVRAVDLPRDQVGIVAFNEKATVVSPLSGDGAAIGAVVAGIALAAGTRIDMGLRAAQEVLAGPERRAANTAVVIVLTDGIQSQSPELPHALAGELRQARVELFVVGLGEDVDVDYLKRLAGVDMRLYLSPTPERLAGIYQQLALAIPCPADQFWGGR